MTDEIKHLPDFYVGDGYLVEVVGCGRDLTLKFRESKRRSLDAWAQLQRLCVFVYNSKLQAWWLVMWPEFAQLYDAVAISDGVQAFSSDGNRFVALEWELIGEVAHMGGTVE